MNVPLFTTKRKEDKVFFLYRLHLLKGTRQRQQFRKEAGVLPAKTITLYLNLHRIAGTESVTFPPSFPAAPGRPWSPGGPGGPGCPLSPLGPVPPVGPCGPHETSIKYLTTLHTREDRLQAAEITLVTKCYILVLPLWNSHNQSRYFTVTFNRYCVSTLPHSS